MQGVANNGHRVIGIDSPCVKHDESNKNNISATQLVKLNETKKKKITLRFLEGGGRGGGGGI